MITRILVALVALYLVAGAPKPDAIETSLRQQALPATLSEPGLARQALEFCATNRETCTRLAGQLIENAAPVRETGSVMGVVAPVSGRAQPVPAPHLPLPPRRRVASGSGA